MKIDEQTFRNQSDHQNKENVKNNNAIIIIFVWKKVKIRTRNHLFIKNFA